MLTSHFLLFLFENLFEKVRIKALKKNQEKSLNDETETFYFDLEKLVIVGIHKSFFGLGKSLWSPKERRKKLTLKQG